MNVHHTPGQTNKQATSFTPRIITDREFELNLPKDFQRLSKKHWTTAAIARRATKFLVDKPGTRVLDIGSGVGKFCITGAAFADGIFTGVEQRQNLCVVAESIAKQYQLHNVVFIHANIMDIDFSAYDAFFFYNSFYENIDTTEAIDDKVSLSSTIYRSYNLLLAEKLSKMPIGTRIVTYHGDCVPQEYELLYANGNDSLKFWEKRS